MIEANRLLVIAPHPDDEILGCGGTIALAAEGGAEVHVLIVFDGAAGDPQLVFESGSYTERRHREARAGGERIGVSGYTFWNLPEGHLALDHELEEGARRLEDLIRDVRPDLILAPWEGDEHPDHQTVSRAVRRWLDGSNRFACEVWGFEVWSPLDADHLVDVSTVWDAKVDALREHVTQLVYTDLIEKMTTLATRHRAGLLESFARLGATR